MDTLESRLEEMIDETNLSLVLETIASVCYAKADHVQTNWQDKSLAMEWEEAGDRVISVAMRITV